MKSVLVKVSEGMHERVRSLKRLPYMRGKALTYQEWYELANAALITLLGQDVEFGELSPTVTILHKRLINGEDL